MWLHKHMWTWVIWCLLPLNAIWHTFCYPWAALKGVSLADIYEVATWRSLSSVTRYYRLNMWCVWVNLPFSRNQYQKIEGFLSWLEKTKSYVNTLSDQFLFLNKTVSTLWTILTRNKVRYLHLEWFSSKENNIKILRNIYLQVGTVWKPWVVLILN